jgi:endonuclease YncB( thermonuclease family)
MKRYVRRSAPAFIALVIAGSAAAGPLIGTPRIVDGDTVEISGTKIRLQGVDTPETDQVCFTASGARDACGVRARDALMARFGDKPWTCTITGTDRYSRSLGGCTAGGEDVQRWLVREGLALSFVRYAHTYDADEAAARENKAGLWAGCFVAPWEWRARNDKTVLLGSVCPVGAQKDLLSSVSSSEAPDPNCTIKGNVNRSGECIYHQPGGKHYAKVKMDFSKGKRWFCSIAEAEAAGCRAPKS